MKPFSRCLLGLGLLAAGYLLGASGLLTPGVVRAQPSAPAATEETVAKLKAVHEAMTVATQALQGEGLYTPATNTLNAFAVASGGVNAMDDLESGRGVDPETFAGLYAGMAGEEVAPHLGRDEEGRLTYKGKIVRMYPISRLKRMFAERARLSGGEADEAL
jgi:hypothetical protein